MPSKNPGPPSLSEDSSSEYPSCVRVCVCFQEKIIPEYVFFIGHRVVISIASKVKRSENGERAAGGGGEERRKEVGGVESAIAPTVTSTLHTSLFFPPQKETITPSQGRAGRDPTHDTNAKGVTGLLIGAFLCLS